ncbi:hypothetical protein BN1708_006384 [Verticillium longisporum]|uniref:Uncharacterized protein n=1 Tax=Verticillium longisporum TaxID=100787 RepID=A0A0G4MK51_VERLO|nr:hypothetical protein BN1708_006384 [Verticillium longisporum]
MWQELRFMIPIMMIVWRFLLSLPPMMRILSMICDPAVAEPQSYDDMLPCAKAKHIEEFLCRPNGTNPTDLEDHAECMCKGDFFGEKLACDTCMRDNGGIDILELALYDNLLHGAYDQLCLATAAPTAPFASI